MDRMQLQVHCRWLSYLHITLRACMRACVLCQAIEDSGLTRRDLFLIAKVISVAWCGNMTRTKQGAACVCVRARVLLRACGNRCASRAEQAA